MSTSDKEKSNGVTTVVSVNDGYSDEVNGVLSTVMSPSGKVVQFDQRDLDDALQYLDEIKELEIDPAVEKKLLRKIDICLMPLIALVNACMMMDKGSNSYASIMNLQPDLGMSSYQYSWVGSVLYFGYMVFNYPGVMLLQKFPVSKMLSLAILIWGIVLMCHAACTNVAGFLTVRFFLGAFEGVMIPAYIMINTQWYKQEEQFMRSCIYIGFQGLGSVMGAGIAHGLYEYWDHSFAAWRMLFIITGIMTIFVAFLSFIHIPDIPTKAWFLNEEEKAIVVARIRKNQQGFGNHKIKKHQVIEGFKDIALYLFFIYGFTYGCANGSFSNMGSIMMRTVFHFNTSSSLLMGMVGGSMDFIFAPLCAWLTSRYLKNMRLVCSAIVNAICIIGMCLFAFSKPKGSQLAGYLTFYLATSVLACVASVITSNVAGSSKKTTASTFFFVGYCVGNITGPQTFKAPPYTGAKICLLVSFIVGTMCLCGLLFIYNKRNKERDAYKLSMGDAYKVPDNIEFADLTDKENPEFRYSL